MRTRPLVRSLRTLIAGALSFVLVALSPGHAAYAALAQNLGKSRTSPAGKPRAVPNLSLPAPGLKAAASAASIPEGVAAAAVASSRARPLSAADRGATSTKAKSVVAALAAEGHESGQRESDERRRSQADRIWNGSSRRSDEGGGVRAGSAFGVGEAHSLEKHSRTNAIIAEAFKEGRASLAYSSEPGAGEAPSAAEDERAAVSAALEAFAPSDKKIVIEGLGETTVAAALSALKRIVLVDSPSGRPAAALRHESADEFQVSHVGFGPEHDKPTIYLSRALLAQAAPQALRAVLLNDLVELGAMTLARKASASWTEELSKKVAEIAAGHAGGLMPSVVPYVRVLVAGLRSDFEDLGLSADLIRREYLSSNPDHQQDLLNRLAALRAKGFEAGELSPALLKLQESLDVLAAGEEGPSRAAAEEVLRQLKASDAKLHEKLTQGDSAHSSVSGLALRADKALRAGRDASAMLRRAGDPRAVERLWKAWGDPDSASMIPALDNLPQIRTTLAEAVDKVRAQVVPEKVLLEREVRSIELLIGKHPLAESWKRMRSILSARAQALRAQLKELPPVRGSSPEARELRRLKGESREDIRGLSGQAADLKGRLDQLGRRAGDLAMLSLAMREWFTGAKGLSLSGDYLWDKDGRNLDMLLIVPGDSSPRKLRPEVLRRISGLNASSEVEVSGYVVGEKWLRGAYFDADRSALVSRFSLLGLSLWGPNLAEFYRKLPQRELWAAAADELAAARRHLASTRPRDAALPLKLALSLMTALGLRIHGRAIAERLPQWRRLVDESARLGSKPGREVLESHLAALSGTLETLREQGRISALERRLALALERSRREALGQVGGVLLGSASASAAPSSPKPLYELAADEARRWLDEVSQEGRPLEDSAAALKSALERLHEKARYWEWLPQSLSLGAFALVGATAFGRPVEVRVRVREIEDRPELMGLIAPAAPDRDSAGRDRYEIFINGAVLRMEPEVQEVVLGSLARQLELAMEGAGLDEARDAAAAELQEVRVRDDRKDREVLESALAAYRAGVRVEPLSEPKTEEPAVLKGTRRARQSEFLRLAQAVSDYLKAPQRGGGGKILLGYTVEAMKPLVEGMAEVLAGNGIEVSIAEGETLPASLHHAVREGAYRMGFLISRESFLPVGHYKGQLPERELAELIAAESVVKRVKRLSLEAAKLQGLATVRADIQQAYLASLKERFDAPRIARSRVGLVIDTEESEVEELLRALGLKAEAADLGENPQALRERLAQANARKGEKRLGVSLGRDGTSIRILDLDGTAMRPSDLSLLFTWYLVTRRGHHGRVFRAFAQTRLLDRLAQRHGLTVEEVDPSVWGITEADSIILSPWTPYNDMFSQALLAAEIVATTGRGLGELLSEIRGELGAELHYEKASVGVPAALAEKSIERLSAEELKKALARSLGLAEGSLSARKSHNGIQVSLDSGGWLYLRSTQEGFEIYAEDADAALARGLVRGGRLYLSGLIKELGPSLSLKLSLLFTTVTAGLSTALVLLPMMDPGIALQTPIIGGIYVLVGRMVEMGFGALEWLFPNMLRRVLPSWNNPWVMGMSVLMFLEFFGYWGARALTFYSSALRTKSQGELAPEIERLPDLPRQPQPEANDYFTVAPLRDGRLAALKPAFARVWTWLQPLLFTYQAQTLIQGKRYDDSNALYRGGINARAWLFFKSLLLEPRIIFMTWWNLLSAVFPKSSGVLVQILGLPGAWWSALWGRKSDWNPVPGLPTHVSPAVGIALPAVLRGRYRTEFASVKKISDGDTIQLFDGSFFGGRWVRYKGMDASDNKKGDLYRRAKERNIQMLRSQKDGKVLLLIPQIKQGEGLADEYDVNGRVLAYVYVQDESGQWVNLSLLLLREGLATTEKGAPDPEVPYSLDVSERAPRRKSMLEARTPPLESEPLSAEALLADQTARRRLKEAGAEVSESAQLSLARSFTGERGERLKGRLGRGAALAERSQLLVSGEGVRLGGALRLLEDARLNLAAHDAESTFPHRRQDGSLPLAAEAGKLSVGDGVVVSGKFRITVPAASRLRILNGTKLEGERRIVVPEGESMTLRTLPDGTLSLQSDYGGPAGVARRARELLRRGAAAELADLIRVHGLDSKALLSWWRSRTGYDPLRLAPKLESLPSVSKERSGALEGRHQDFVAEAVAAKENSILRGGQGANKFLMRGEPPKIKQALLLGLERHYEVLLGRGRQSVDERVKSLERKLERAGLHQAERRTLVKILKEGTPRERREASKGLSRDIQKDIAKLERAIESLRELEAAMARELDGYLERARGRLARLSGLILMGPERFPEAVGVVAGGDYLLSRDPKSLEILVVTAGEESPRRLDEGRLKGLSLPEGLKLTLVSVGEEWLKGNPKDGMRSRLLSRSLLTGATLWGRDVAGMRPQSLDRLSGNLLAVAEELADEAGESEGPLYLAHLLALSAAPGILPRIKEESGMPGKELSKRVREQIRSARELARGRQLEKIVGRGLGEASRHAYADSGIGGVLIGEVERSPLYKQSSREAWGWIKRLAESSAPVEGAQAKLDALLEALKSRGLWWLWLPERLEEGRFAVMGRDGRGRVVEARVRVAYAPQESGTLAILAESEEGRSISDVDRYEIFLNGIIFEMDSAAQETVLRAVVRQLELALAGRSLREARDASSRELAADDLKAGGRGGARHLLRAIEEHAQGLRTRALKPVLRLPWRESAWRGELGTEGALRLAKGLGDYASAHGAAGAGFLLGYEGPAQKAAAEAMAEVLSAMGLPVSFLEAPLGLDRLAAVLKQDTAEMGIWISPQETSVVGKAGQGLTVLQSNQVGWLALRSQSARTMPLEVARERGLLKGVAVPAASAAAAPVPAEQALPEARRSSLGPLGAFLAHSLILGSLAAIVAGTAVFPAFALSLPFVHVIFTMGRSMMMFKSLLSIGNAWAVGIILGVVVTGLRYWRYGKTMYAMSQGGGAYRGLIPELESLPKIRTKAKRSQNWVPVEALLDGRVAIREESFARLSPAMQMLIYAHAAARLRFNGNPVSRFFINMANKLVIGRFKIAKVTFFVLTEPFVMVMEWLMLARAFGDWLRGRPVDLLVRVSPESRQGVPVLPREAEKDFSAEWVTVTAILDESTVQLEDGRQIRVVGAGKPGKGVPLATPQARELLLGPELLLVVPDAQEEGARRIAGHLYAAQADQPGPSRVWTRAVHAVAARQANYGHRLPAAAAVDADKLPLFLDLADSASERPAGAAARPAARWERIYAGALLLLNAVLGGWAFHLLFAPALSPLAHYLAVGILGFVIPTILHGLVSLWRVAGRGFAIRHKFVAAIPALALALGLSSTVRDPSWAVRPAADTISGAAMTVLDGARLLPRPKVLGYESGPAQASQPYRLSLPEGHPLVEQARGVLGSGGAESAAVALPPELAAKYRALWAFVVKVDDGDTVVLSNGIHVRYVGVNTPETFHAGMDANEPAQPGGVEAGKRNEELVNRKKVLLLVPRGRDRDHYKRLLAYIYAPESSGKLVNVNVTLLEEGHGNARYGLPDPLLWGRYRRLDPKVLGEAAPVQSGAESAPRLALNPRQTRTFVQEQAAASRWLDPLTLELQDGRRVRLRELDIPAGKARQALSLVRRLVPSGSKIFILNVKAYDSKDPYHMDEEGRLLDYVYFSEDGGKTYRNLNALVFDQGLSTTLRGKPDPALPERASLEREVVSYERAAWEAAQAPLNALQIENPQLLAAYWDKVRGLDADSAKPFQAGASLLALYARQMMVPAARQEWLLSELLASRVPSEYDSWVADKLVPLLRGSLAAQKIPLPAGQKSWSHASWQDVLLWGSAGKLGAVPDALYFPSAEQAARMREFLERQGAARSAPMPFGEGLIHARLHLRLPADFEVLVPGNVLDRSVGAFWAAAEAAQWHRALLHNEASRVSPLLMGMAYSQPESPWLMLPQAPRYAFATQALAREALATPGLLDAVFERLKAILAEERFNHVRGLIEQGKTGAAVKELSPSELFMLGRLLADAPQLNRYQLASLRELRSIAGRVAVQGTPMADFQRELDALLGLPGGGSLAAAPLEKYETLAADSWGMQRRLFADVLLQVLSAMEQEKIPARFLPLILPRAVETIERSSSRAASAQDWETLLKALRKVTRGKARSWVYEQMARGYAGGDPLGTGLVKRDLASLLAAELGSAISGEAYDEKKVVGSLGFAASFEADLKTFKSGSFRVDMEEGHYHGWKAGDLVKIMAGAKSNRRALFNTRLQSVEKKRLGELTLDDLQAEFPPTRFWNPLDDDEALRRELIAELIERLRLYHPGVDENTHGLLMRFDSYAAVSSRRR